MTFKKTYLVCLSSIKNFCCLLQILIDEFVCAGKKVIDILSGSEEVEGMKLFWNGHCCDFAFWLSNCTLWLENVWALQIELTWLFGQDYLVSTAKIRP